MSLAISCQTILTQIEIEEELTSQQLNLSWTIQSFFYEASSSTALFSVAAGQGFAALVQSKGYRLLSPLFCPKFSKFLSTFAGYITEGICFNSGSELARSGEFKIAELGETAHGISTITLCKMMSRRILGDNILIQNLLQNSALVTLDIGFEEFGLIEKSHFSFIERYTHCQITSFRMEISAKLLAVVCPQVGILKAKQELDYEIQNSKNDKTEPKNKKTKPNIFFGEWFAPAIAGNHGQIVRNSSSYEITKLLVEAKNLICRIEKSGTDDLSQKKELQIKELGERETSLLNEPLKLIPPTAQRMLASTERGNELFAGILKGIWITLYGKIHYLREVSDKKSLMDAFEVASYIYLKHHAQISAIQVIEFGKIVFFENVPEHENYFYPFFSDNFQSMTVTKNLDSECRITTNKTARQIHEDLATPDLNYFFSLPDFVLSRIKKTWEEYEKDPESNRGLLGFVTWIRKAQKKGKIRYPPCPYSPIELAIDFFPVRDFLLTSKKGPKFLDKKTTDKINSEQEKIITLNENESSDPEENRENTEQNIYPSSDDSAEREAVNTRLKALENILIGRRDRKVKSSKIPTPAILLIRAMAEANLKFSQLRYQASIEIDNFIDEICGNPKKDILHPPQMILRVEEVLQKSGGNFNAAHFFATAHPFLADIFPTLLQSKPFIQLTRPQFEEASEFDLAYSIFSWRMKGNKEGKVIPIDEIRKRLEISDVSARLYETRATVPKIESLLRKLIDLITEEKNCGQKQSIYLAVRYGISSILPIIILESDRSRKKLNAQDIYRFQKKRKRKSSSTELHPAFTYFLGTNENGEVFFPSEEKLNRLDETLRCSEKTLNPPYQKKRSWSSLSRDEKWAYYLYDLAVQKFGSAEAAVKETGLLYLKRPHYIKREVSKKSWKDETIAQYAKSLELSDSERRNIFIFFREKEIRELLQK